MPWNDIGPQIIQFGKVFHSLDSMHFVITLTCKCSHYIFCCTNCWAVDSSENDTCRNWRTTYCQWCLTRLSLFCFMACINHGFCSVLDYLFIRLETELMFTSVLLKCRMACIFVQGLIGERITTSRIVHSFLAELLPGLLLYFRSHKIPSICLIMALRTAVLENINLSKFFLFVQSCLVK